MTGIVIRMNGDRRVIVTMTIHHLRTGTDEVEGRMLSTVEMLIRGHLNMTLGCPQATIYE